MAEFERTFDLFAYDYEKSRPEYAREIYNDIFRYKPVFPESELLEIGVGTGKATTPFLDTGCRYIGVEPGERLFTIAKNRFRSYENFALLNQTFEDFSCGDGSFDLIFAATAFHRIPEDYGYKKVFRLLKPGGAFARFSYHAGEDRGRPALADEIRSLYRLYMQSESPPAFCEKDAKKLSEKAIFYGFSNAKYSLYHTKKDFTAEEYAALLRTYPDHAKLPDPRRKKLIEGITCAIERHGGVITVYYTTDLELARKPLQI